MNNPPLLTQFRLPPFSSILTSDIEFAIDVVVNYCYSIVEEVLSQKYANTWDTLCYPIQISENQLKRVWSPIEHLNSVRNTLELRRIYKKTKKIVLEYEIWISQNRGLYFAYYNLYNSSYYLTLTVSQKKLVINNLHQFKLSGIELSRLKRKRCKTIHRILSSLTNIYDNNVLDSTESWKKLILDKSRLFGCPKYVLDRAALEAKNDGKNGWLLTLKFPVYLSVMKYCEDDVLREEMYWAYNTRASDQGPDAGRWDNTVIIDEILSLRYELAKLLGFDSHANKVLINRMVKTSDRVVCFLKSLSTFIVPCAKKVFIDLEQFAKKYYGCKKLYPWDMLFYIEKQKESLFLLSEEELCYFFYVDRVLHGMFSIVNSVYGIKVYERYDVDVWHPDVRFFDVFNIYNQRLGSFYLDIYARDNKYSGAWMDVCVDRMYGLHSSIKQKPIAYLVCNFIPVREGEYIFLSHDDISTLFHEFGHVLHHVMTIVDIPEISGINGVSLDAVEIPSQFMEKFSWDVEVLQTFAIHYLTGEALSIRLINQLLRLRRYQLSFSLLYRLIYSIFDIHIHYESYLGKNIHFMQVFNDIQRQFLIFPTVEWERFPHTFSHIFSCDYSAGYYSYLWSDMLASDIWFYFKEKGIFNYQLGKFFLDQVLSRGGSEEFSDLFYRFRGREARIKYLFRYYYEV